MIELNIIIILLGIAILLFGIDIGIILGYVRIMKIWERQIMVDNELNKEKAGQYIYNKLKEYK